MRCEICGYDHKEIKKHWEYREGNEEEGLTYTILSHFYDGNILKQILNHAMSLRNPPFDLYLDTCMIETNECSHCFMEFLKTDDDRRRVEQQFYDQGIWIHKFF
jgi:hypothetical protein